jgi:hypothetical protein
MRALRLAAVAATVLVLAMCASENTPAPGPFLAIGTWGGDNSGAIVTDTLAHIHIGCTYGDIEGRVRLDEDGKFKETGSYLLHAYPIAAGPTMPAEFTGSVAGTTLMVTVVVHDTVEDKLVTMGPAKMTFGKEPAMGPCPICRTPGSREETAGH